MAKQKFTATEKPCTACGEIKPLSEFHIDTSMKSGRYSKCKVCWNTQSQKRSKEWRENPANKEKVKEHDRRHNLRTKLKIFNLSIKDYEKLLQTQDFKCAICKTNKPGGKGSWHIDHCHEKNYVRGLLCHKCNTGLGLFRDNKQFLNNAMQYLDKNPGTILFESQF